MAKLPRNLLRSFFERNDKPTQAQFAALIDSMLHSTEDADKLGLRIYNPEKTYLAGEGILYNDELYRSLVTTTGPFNALHWRKLSNPIRSIIEKTWYELRDLKNASNLIPGALYLISDFTSDLQTGSEKSWVVPYIYPVDPMIVTAISDNSISELALCPLYPNDIIDYCFDENRITFRKDTVRNLSAHYDWRHWTFERWESQPYKSDFIYTREPLSEPTYMPGTIVEQSPGVNQIVIEGDARPAAESGSASFRYVVPGGEAWVSVEVIITGYSYSITIDGSGNPVSTTYMNYDLTAYPQLVAEMDIQLVMAIRSKHFYTFGNTLSINNAETPVWTMIPAANGNAGEDCRNIELGPVSQYWWGTYANGHIFANECYNIKIGPESINVTMLSNVWDVEMGSDILGGLLMGDNAKVYVNGFTSIYLGKGTASVNVLASGQTYEYVEIGEIGMEIQYKVAVGKNCHSLTLLNCKKSGTASLPGIPNNTTYQVYTEFPLSHDQNTDTSLAQGTTDEVTAAELRSFLDAATGHVFFVDAVKGNDTIAKRNSISKPFQTINAAFTDPLFEDGDTVIVLPGTYIAEGIGDLLELDGKTIRMFCYPGVDLNAIGDIFSDNNRTSGKLEVMGHGNFTSESWVVNFPKADATCTFRASNVHGGIGGFAGNSDSTFYVDIVRATGGNCIYFEGDNAKAFYKAQSAETVQGIMLMDLAGSNTKVYAEVPELVIPGTDESNQFCSALNVNSGSLEFKGNIVFSIPTPVSITPQGAVWLVTGSITMYGNIVNLASDSISIHCWGPSGTITLNGNVSGGQVRNRLGRVVVNGDIITSESKPSAVHLGGVTHLRGWVVNQSTESLADAVYVSGNSGLFLDKARIVSSSATALAINNDGNDVNISFIDTVINVGMPAGIVARISSPVVSTYLVY